ncbi:TPA: hypothetical protein ACV5IO_005667 [Pseudomonas aeruginosa]|nr:hypothetical protein [Escherichia coli]
MNEQKNARDWASIWFAALVMNCAGMLVVGNDLPKFAFAMALAATAALAFLFMRNFVVAVAAIRRQPKE